MNDARRQARQYERRTPPSAAVWTTHAAKRGSMNDARREAHTNKEI